MIESGYPGFVSDTFNALFAPAGTPPDIIDMLVKSSRRRCSGRRRSTPRARPASKLSPARPEQLARRVAAEIQGVKELVARAGIKPEN